eukprot:scaffold69723_cov18-Tisochrysis_lutea.AAC.1
MATADAQSAIYFPTYSHNTRHFLTHRSQLQARPDICHDQWDASRRTPGASAHTHHPAPSGRGAACLRRSGPAAWTPGTPCQTCTPGSGRAHCTWRAHCRRPH